MGHKYEIFAYMPTMAGFEEMPMYQGNSVIQALLALYTSHSKLGAKKVKVIFNR